MQFIRLLSVQACSESGERTKIREMANDRVILFVDDSDDDAFFFQRAVGRASLNIRMRRAVNGQQAIDYLLGVEQFSDREQFPLPSIVILDLKMPVCDGFAFLRWKREQSSLACIPTVVMTSSALETDVRRSYELGANSFTTKVNSIESLCNRLAALRDWWFKSCVLVSA